MLGAAIQAAEQENWYAALGLALCLPDIAGKIDKPRARSSARYVTWCATYLEPQYVDEDGKRWLTGSDVYALRCAFLHEGSSDTSRQAARNAYRRFQFLYPPPNNGYVHRNVFGDQLQLQVDVFVSDVCGAARRWLLEAEDDRVRRNRLDKLMRIRRLGPRGFSIP